jgi:hypothetical protein
MDGNCGRQVLTVQEADECRAMVAIQRFKALHPEPHSHLLSRCFHQPNRAIVDSVLAVLEGHGLKIGAFQDEAGREKLRQLVLQVEGCDAVTAPFVSVV